jgi:hypothetical protein
MGEVLAWRAVYKSIRSRTTRRAVRLKIVRSPAETGFTQVPNLAVRDSRLSFRARGVHAFLLSHVDEGFPSDAAFLSMHGKEGREACRVALAELEKYGYIRRQRRRISGGRWVTDVMVFTLPAEPEPVENSGDHDD